MGEVPTTCLASPFLVPVLARPFSDPTMIVDYHTHTYMCGHASGTLSAYIETAIERGVDEIALTDHLFLYYEDPGNRDPSLAMREEQYPAHYDAMKLTQCRYRERINVRVSVEADWVSGAEDRLREILSNYDFDFVLGGVHYVDGWLIDSAEDLHNYEKIPLEEIYRAYFRELRSAANSGLFDVLAHFDLPKKFGHKVPDSVKPIVLETLDCVKESGCAIEVSSVGLRDPIRECYPGPWIIEEMGKRDISIVLSSDAHAPAEVAYDFDRLIPMLLDSGYRSIVTFDQREPAVQPLA